MSSSSFDGRPTGALAVRLSDAGDHVADLGDRLSKGDRSISDPDWESLDESGIVLIDGSGPLGRALGGGRLPDTVLEALPVLIDSRGRTLLVAPRVTVRFSRKVAEGEAANWKAGLVSLFEPGVPTDAYSIPVPRGEDAFDFAESVRANLSTNDADLTAEPEILFRMPTSSGPAPAPVIAPENIYLKQWHLRNRKVLGADIHAEGAWEFSKGKGKTIAIIDLGFYMKHPNLKSGIAAGSGHFTSSSAFFPEDEETATQYHGTMCAGMAAARPSRRLIIYGAAPAAKLLLLSVDKWTSGEILARVFRYIMSGPCIAYPFLRPPAGPGLVGYCLPGRADVISMSGSPLPGSSTGQDLLKSALDDLPTVRDGRGIPTFCSTSNAGDPIEEDFVGSHPNTFAVGRSDKNDELSKSGTGPELDFLAPGSLVWSTQPPASGGQLYQLDSGTSFATPLAAGIAAQVLSINENLDLDEVRHIMHTACDRLNAMESGADRDNNHGHGRINAMKAALYAKYTTA